MGESSLIGGASGAGTVEVAQEPMSLGQSDGQAAEAWVIGIDCAAQDRNMGLVLGRVQGPKVEVEAVAFNKNDVRPILSEWIRYRNPLILSLDAPLGWPIALGEMLQGHRAGEGIGVAPNHLFSRHTDRFVLERTGKRPMEVGADRIARTALRAVGLVSELRESTGKALPLALAAGYPAEPSVIEVYPALVLRARGLSDLKYKGRQQARMDTRELLLDELADESALGNWRAALVGSEHAFDGLLCVLGALDFLAGKVEVPDAAALARTEGWIWFRTP